jgi:hypothetical protein
MTSNITDLGGALVDISAQSLENDRALLKLCEALVEKFTEHEKQIEDLTIHLRVLQNRNDDLVMRVDDLADQMVQVRKTTQGEK